MSNHIPRVVIASLLAALFFTPRSGLAGPADLLKQAIEEEGQREPASTAENGEILNLLNEAQQFESQKRFDEAIRLYEKAYRLDPANQANYARLLVAKRSAGKMTEQDREALALLEEQQAASIDQVLRSVRLAFIQAGQANRAGDTDLAQQNLDTAARLLDTLPAFVDADPYRTELKRLTLAVSRKARRTREAAPAEAPESRENTETHAIGSTVTMTEISQDIPCDDVTVTTTVETGQIIDVQGLIHDDHARHVYDRELASALAHQRANVILSNNEAAMPPPTTGLNYPSDWPEKSARRARWRDGVVYRTPSFTGEDGQEYYTAIYDLGDLVHPVPNFYASFPGFGADQYRELLDREALRERSWIFNRGAEDLAAGLPLLHFFGGVDNNAVSTRTDPREVDRVMATLELFINR